MSQSRKPESVWGVLCVCVMGTFDCSFFASPRQELASEVFSCDSLDHARSRMTPEEFPSGVPEWQLCHHLRTMPFYLSPASNQWAPHGNKEQTQRHGALSLPEKESSCLFTQAVWFCIQKTKQQAGACREKDKSCQP